MSTPAPNAHAPASRRSHATGDHARDWFLQGSCWSDDLWILAPTNALEEERPVILRWNFSLPNGQRFTDARHAALLESARQHLALLRTGAPTAAPCSSRTLSTAFQCLRSLIRWMTLRHIERFLDLDAAQLTEFAETLRRRRGRAAPQITRSTLTHYYGLLIRLYRHRHALPDALQVDPFPGRSARGATARAAPTLKRSLYTPEQIAVPLIHGAMEFLALSAVPILAARERCLRAYTDARQRGIEPRTARTLAFAPLRGVHIESPCGPMRLDSRNALSALLDLLYGACFVILAYLIGARASELLHLQAGCVRPCGEGASQRSGALAVIAGAIYKHESYHGRPHQWVAPDPALHAIAVLEALSAPHRARSGREDLWQRPSTGGLRLAEWLPGCHRPLRISESRSLNARVNHFARALALPALQARRWRFSSHQGRRTFARFVALRDRTALRALAQHFGHRDVRETDSAYAGTDYELTREIDAAVLDRSVLAWEQMLTAPALSGRMGEALMTRRPHFRGGRAQRDLRAYARLLAEAGLTLGVCEWGYCVYRQEFSACRGSASAPDPVYREPSTCARCLNFALTEAHRPYWAAQVERYQALLNDERLPTQTLRIARARLEEARALLRSLDPPKPGART